MVFANQTAINRAAIVVATTWLSERLLQKGSSYFGIDAVETCKIDANRHQFIVNGVTNFDFISNINSTVDFVARTPTLGGTNTSMEIRLNSQTNATTLKSNTTSFLQESVDEPTDLHQVRVYNDTTDIMRLLSNGRVAFDNLPTSAVGLTTGMIWNDSGTLKIV